MPKKVFITRRIPEEGIKMLKDKGYNVKISPYKRVIGREELLKSVKGIDALLSLLTDKIDSEVMEAAGANLKVIANYAVGYDNIDVKEAKKRNILITNTPGVLTETVADHTFCLLVAIAHRIVEADKFTRAGEFKAWAPMLLLGSDIYEKTIGIIGLGRIGKAVALRAHKGFLMKILYYDVNRDEEFEKEMEAEYLPIKELIKKADFITLHVPLLPTTRHLIGAKEFALMKKNAILINTARGPVIDEKALVKALKTKKIQGAALDVFEFEPKLVPGLTNLENVILTPHIASASYETRGKMSKIAAENIIAVLEGKTPPNLVS